MQILIDKNNRVSDTKITIIAAQVSKKIGKVISAESGVSNKLRALQTNDFIIGSIGRMHNRNDQQFIEKLGIIPKNKKLRFHISKELPFIKR